LLLNLLPLQAEGAIQICWSCALAAPCLPNPGRTFLPVVPRAMPRCC